MRISDWSSDVCSSDLTRLWMRTADGGTSTRIELAPFSTRYRSLAVSIWLSQANERKAAFGIARCQTERLKLGRAADHVHITMLIHRLRPRPTISARICPMLRSDMAGQPGCPGWNPPQDRAPGLLPCGSSDPRLCSVAFVGNGRW